MTESTNGRSDAADSRPARDGAAGPWGDAGSAPAGGMVAGPGGDAGSPPAGDMVAGPGGDAGSPPAADMVAGPGEVPAYQGAGSSGPAPAGRPAVSRRGLIVGGAAAAAAGAAAGGGATAAFLSGRPSPAGPAGDTDSVDLTATVPFYDQKHQAGIRTPPQRHAVFMTFNLNRGATRQDLQVLLARWSAAIDDAFRSGRPAAVATDTGAATCRAFPVTSTAVFDERFDLAVVRPVAAFPVTRCCPSSPVATRRSPITRSATWPGW